MVFVLNGCAAPPLTFYVLDRPAADVNARRPSGVRFVIGIDRVEIPDDIDTQDIVVRRGSVLERSHQGRLASRLSIQATDLLTARLAPTRPDALVIDQPQPGPPAWRISIDISRLDVAGDPGATEGTATLDADWTIVSLDPTVPLSRGRIILVAAGPIRTDQDVITLEAGVLDRLAGAIDIRRLRSR
jgi:uncharacterized lipoprotein YmbA